MMKYIFLLHETRWKYFCGDKFSQKDLFSEIFSRWFISQIFRNLIFTNLIFRDLIFTDYLVPPFLIVGVR